MQWVKDVYYFDIYKTLLNLPEGDCQHEVDFIAVGRYC